jgi:hypothetical protein
MVEKKQSRQTRRQLLSIAIVLCLTTVQLVAQAATGAEQNAPAVPPTMPVLYRHFLAYQLHLDRRADELKKVGRNGEDFRTHFQKEIGLSDDAYAKVRTSALLLEKKLAAKDAEAAKVIQADRKANAGRVGLGFGGPPPLPAALTQLQKDRDGIINDEVRNLRSELMPSETARFDRFLTEKFSKSVTSQAVLPPHVSQPQLLKKGGQL